jgi:photosystem II stability/assembly factor-like uncharacterized protein
LIPGRLLAAAVACAAAFACAQACAAGGGFADVLEQPAKPSALAEKSILQSITRAGTRLVAVGQRGHILVSDDAGGGWTQSRVPVSADLTAVHFIDRLHGWAVGHDGVILASDDGGDSWRVQMRGTKGERDSADKSFLDVWFADARTGYAVGAYNLLYRTLDGGATWESWSDRTDNPKQFNLHAVRAVAGSLFIAGEAGLLLKLDESSRRFRAVEVPYKGSFFGIAAVGSSILLHGLRGSAFISPDAGRTWTRVEPGLAGAIVASAQAVGGRLLLADASGAIVASDDGARTFEPLIVRPSLPIAGLASVSRGLVAVVGPRGTTLARVTPR